MTFPQQLEAAWKRIGLAVSPRRDGVMSFACPKCPVADGGVLEVAGDRVACPDCHWSAFGTVEAIEQVALLAMPDVETELDVTLAKIRYNPQAPPPQPVALFSLAGNIIATAENIMVVQAKMKAGKSAAIGAMIASTMQPQGDCLGFASSNDDGKALLHFDTEQSGYDHYQVIRRSLTRAEKTLPPDWFYSYHVKGHSIAQIRAMVARAIERAARVCGGVHSMILDGIADLCVDVNDAAEANELVAWLESLAMWFRCLIVCVLHENHGSDSGKTRGHLGSQLARKAETNLRLEKNAEGTTIMFADTSRSVHITKKNAPGFRWCDEARCHVSCGPTIGAIAVEKSRAELQQACDLIFTEEPNGVSWAFLRSALAGLRGISDRSAERDITKMVEFFMIKRTGEMYHKVGEIEHPNARKR